MDERPAYSYCEIEPMDSDATPIEKIANVFQMVLKREPTAVIVIAAVDGDTDIVVAVAGPVGKIAWIDEETRGSVERVLTEMMKNEMQELNG